MIQLDTIPRDMFSRTEVERFSLLALKEELHRTRAAEASVTTTLIHNEKVLEEVRKSPREKDQPVLISAMATMLEVLRNEKLWLQRTIGILENGVEAANHAFEKVLVEEDEKVRNKVTPSDEAK